jgi:uncharacterized protein (TIGR00369 family)
MEDLEGYTLLPVQDDHNCFACGPANSAGLKMRFYSNVDSVVSWLSVPDHLRGWNNLTHGGVISTILDEIMSWTAIHLLKRIILTKSMTVDFLRPVYVGTRLKAVGRIQSVRGENEAVMEGFLYDAQQAMCARARGTFALLKPKVARKLGIVDDAGLQRLLAETGD